MPRVNVKDKRKQQLIEANIASIAKRGLAETTIAHVSSGAGMSRGIVNFYFTTKDAMMLETLKFLLEEGEQAWRKPLENASLAGQERLSAIIKALFHASLCSVKRLTVLTEFWGYGATHTPYRKLLQQADETLLATLAGLIDEIQPEAGREQAENFASQLLAAVKGSWVFVLHGPQGMGREHGLQLVLGLMERLLTPVNPVASMTGFAAIPEASEPLSSEDATLPTAEIQSLAEAKAARNRQAKKPKKEEIAAPASDDSQVDLFSLLAGSPKK